LATYEYKKLNSKDFISQLYKDGLKKARYLNDEDVEQIICEMGIFKFKGYFRAFKFNISNYSIEDVLFLYLFDRYLSKELLGLCLTFEAKLKSVLVEQSYEQTENPFFYLIKSNYLSENFKIKNEILENWKMRRYPNNESYTHYHSYYIHTYKFEENKERYLKNIDLLISTQDTNFPPFHYLTESATFGIIKAFINNLTINNNDMVNLVAKKFGFYQIKRFKSYIERVNEIRNRCAHNSRIFNRTYRSVTAFGKYKFFRGKNISEHGIIDVYLTLYHLLNRVDNFSDFNDFYTQTIDRLFDSFLIDYETNIISNNLINRYSKDEFNRLKEFIEKGMGIKKAERASRGSA